MHPSHLDWPFFDEAHRALAHELERWIDDGSRIPARVHHNAADATSADADTRAWVRALGDAGFLRYCVPAAYGGVLESMDSRALCVIRESLAAHDALADFAFAMQGLGSGAITLDGSDEMRTEWLPKVARGDAIAAFALSVGMPGIAMIFAGDEVGATGWWGEDSRTPFPWDEVQAWDEQVLQAYRALIDLRRHSPALAEGGLRWVQVEADAIAFLREHPDERLLLVVCRGQREPLRIPLDAIDRAACTHVLGFEGVAASDHLTVQLPSAGVGIWRLDAQPDA